MIATELKSDFKITTDASYFALTSEWVSEGGREGVLTSVCWFRQSCGSEVLYSDPHPGLRDVSPWHPWWCHWTWRCCSGPGTRRTSVPEPDCTPPPPCYSGWHTHQTYVCWGRGADPVSSGVPKWGWPSIWKRSEMHKLSTVAPLKTIVKSNCLKKLHVKVINLPRCGARWEPAQFGQKVTKCFSNIHIDSKLNKNNKNNMP